MLALLLPIILLLFLLIGGAVFVACIALPPLRRYALSAALWCAMWGPCIAGMIMVTGIAILSDVTLTQRNGVSNFHLPHPSHLASWMLAAIVVLLIAVVATGVAWLHQAAIHRLTLALFRLYATVISAGIGGVFGFWFGWWLIGEPVRFAPFLAIAAMALLTMSFGAGAYRGARSLRGDPPKRLTWISAEEFNGI